MDDTLRKKRHAEYMRRYRCNPIVKQRRVIEGKNYYQTIGKFKSLNLRQFVKRQKRQVDYKGKYKYVRNKKLHNFYNQAQTIPMKDSCDICKDKLKLTRHHFDYSKPKIFSTLCYFCHNVQHHIGGKSMFGVSYQQLAPNFTKMLEVHN